MRITDTKQARAKTDQRWFPAKGLNGSPQGLAKLPNPERAELYRQLSVKVGASQAHAMRDWRPTKIALFLRVNIDKVPIGMVN